jgi:hypothetical protein
MKKFLVVLAVAVSSVLNAQTNIINSLNVGSTISKLEIASANLIKLSYDSLITNVNESQIDSLINSRYELIMNEKFTIDVFRIDNGIVEVAIVNNNAFKPENFDQTATNGWFVTSLNNVESLYNKGTLISEIETVFVNLK